MSDANDLQLAAEMAVISTVKSSELVEMARDTAALQKLQEQLDDNKDSVQIVKKVLTGLEPHKLDLVTAKQMDNYLQRADVDLPVDELGNVQGVECLGHTLMPAAFIQTRLQGCESFLGDFYRKAKEITAQISIGFRESYLLFTQSTESLEALLDILDKDIQAQPSFKAGTDTILLGTRLFNQFKVGGKVNEDWVGGLTKLNSTISALSNNYYLANRGVLNNTLSYFGGFDGLTDEAAKERFLLLPKSIVSVRFKECSYPNKDNTTATVVAKQSVELMGGAYFLDQRREKVNTSPSNVEQVMGYVHDYVDLDLVGFQNNSPVEYPKIGTEIKTLSSDTIKALVKLMRETLKAWRKTTEGMERYKVADSDFNDIVKGIYESPMSDELKDQIQTAFTSIVRKHQIELLTNRAAINNYLVLIFNGLIELCNTSISANAPQ